MLLQAVVKRLQVQACQGGSPLETDMASVIQASGKEEVRRILPKPLEELIELFTEVVGSSFTRCSGKPNKRQSALEYKRRYLC
jgi:hypothetical protein